MADILKQIKVGNTTYDIEPVTAYLPLTGGTINAGGSKAPLILKGGTSNWNEGLRILPAGNWSTIMLGGKDIKETEGTSANSWSIHNNDGKFYISKNGSDYASTKLSNTDGTWRVNDNTIIHSGNIGSQNVNYATSAGNADTLDGDHSSAFARVASHNNLMASSDEFTFASSGFSGAVWLNYRTAGGTNGSITEYKLGNGAGKALGSIIHTGNIGSQSVNYATSAHLLRTYNAGNGSHGADYYLKCRHNVDGNDRFKLQIVRSDGSVTHSTSVDYANSANTANYFNYGRGVTLANSSSFINNFNKDIFGEENNNNYHLVELRTQSQAPSCLLGDYSSGIAWKGSDTYGSLMVRYNTSEIRVSGGNGANTNPNWTVDLVHSGNIGSQNVNYANSAGSVAWGNVTGKPSTFPPIGHGHSTATQSGDGFMSSTDKKKLDGIAEGANKIIVDSSISSTSNNPVQNSTIYSAFSNAVRYDHDYYSSGETGSWRLLEYYKTGNKLDIRYGKINIDAQEKTYSATFYQPFIYASYTVVCGIYRSNRNSWFWSPLVTNRTKTGFNVYVRGNMSGDNSGTLMYIAIRSS